MMNDCWWVQYLYVQSTTLSMRVKNEEGGIDSEGGGRRDKEYGCLCLFKVRPAQQRTHIRNKIVR